MHKYFQQFTLITFVGMVVVLIVLGLLYRNAVTNQLIESAQRESIELSHVLGMAVKDNAHILPAIKKMTSKEFRRSVDFTVFDKMIRRYLAGFGVLQVNVFALNGVAIYSTDISLLGSDTSSVTAFKLARSGQIHSELVSIDHFNTIEGTTLSREAVNCYIPVDWSEDGNVDAILQIYIDVTGRMGSLQKTVNKNYIYIGLILLGLFAILFLLIRSADKRSQLHDSEIRRQQHEIDQYVYRDPLTGLPNRFLFKDRLEHAMLKACQYEKLLAVLSLDINRFKYVNDKFGFQAGDELLIQVAERLKRCVRDYDAVSRLGGDNFAIALELMSAVDEASEAANHILEVMSDSFSISGQEIFLTFGIGIAMYPFDDEQADSLMQKSDTALYQANEAGRNTYRFYSSRKREKAVNRFTLENDLRLAIERNEFQLYYQPVVQLNTGAITGVEALLRWHLPSQGIIPPLEFISVLEESGLIIQVGQWVLETACKQGRLWQQQGLGDLNINVNISAKQFRNNNLLQYVNDALEISKLPAHLLNLEITESLLIEDHDRVIQLLDLLNEKGVSMSVDDFGTGYSSMAYLKNMPIETIKIDKTFVRGIPFDMDDVAIIHAIDYLSKNLRLNVIAEGVETETQLSFLRNLNVYAIQGYLVSRPVPASDLESLLRGHNPALYQN